SQLAWKRLVALGSRAPKASPIFSKVACAIGLAVSRSNIAPYLVAFIAGEINIFGIVVHSKYTDGPICRDSWHTLELAGPVFIKWGQWAATHPDLFPSDLCTELSKLHTKAPAHNFTYTKKTVEKAFGRKLSDIFEEDPVASGSVAQVHRAVLQFRYPNRQTKRVTVAVKVRHPGVGDSIRRDFNIINVVAKISRYIPTLNWLRLDAIDLAREAAHLSRFIYNFRRWKDVSFPRPLYPHVHPAILVETYEHGESVSRYVDDLEGHDRIKSALAHTGTHALLKMLLSSSSSSSESSSSDDEDRGSRKSRSQSRSKRTRKEKKSLSRSKRRGGESEEEGPVRLSKFFGKTHKFDGHVTPSNLTLRTWVPSNLWEKIRRPPSNLKTHVLNVKFDGTHVLNFKFD
ncbi:hypothetical protein ACJX0J_039715, partial [Zea mays]